MKATSNGEAALSRLAEYEAIGLSPDEIKALIKECQELRKRKHGLTHTRLYKIWKSMRQRCNSSQHKDFSYYGGRGIRICTEWDDFKVFYDWAMASGYADNLSIDRINNDGNYEPLNCRWVTHSVQQRNKRCKTITFNGETHTIEEWAKIIGVSNDCIRYRLNKKLPTEAVLAPRGR